MKKIFAIVLCLLILLSDQAKATVVFTDSFTVGTNINLSAYPSGSPDYAMTIGTSTNFVVTASTDLVQGTEGADAVARIIDATAPTGDQEITASLNSAGGGAGLCVRLATDGTTNGYLVSFVPSIGRVTLYRSNTGGGLDEMTECNGATWGESFTGKVRATGAGATVTVTGQANAITPCTFADTATNRKLTGVPGIWNAFGSLITVDNISVDNLAATTATTVITSSLKRRRNQ